MLVIDELKKRKRSVGLLFFDFVEALARIAEQLDLPSLDDVIRAVQDAPVAAPAVPPTAPVSSLVVATKVTRAASLMRRSLGSTSISQKASASGGGLTSSGSLERASLKSMPSLNSSGRWSYEAKQEPTHPMYIYLKMGLERPGNWVHDRGCFESSLRSTEFI